MSNQTGKAVLPIEGMHCAACALNIEKALSGAPGVVKVSVNFASEQAFVEYDPALTRPGLLEKVVEQTGYGVRRGEDAFLKEVRRVRRELIIAWAFTLPLTLMMVPHMVTGHAGLHHKWLFVALATPAVFWAGWRTHRRAWIAAAHGSTSMDVLISLGTLTSYGTGIAALAVPVESYAGVGAMIMGFHLIGRYLENLAKGRASQAIGKLLELGARTARVLRDGVEEEVPAGELAVGDVIVVRPGEKISTDAVVIDGESSVDESMVTGEGLPVDKGKGAELIGGTINKQGLLKARVAKVGKDTFLSQVVKMVEECQGSKVPIQALADRIVSYFVPVVLAIAVLTFLAWFIFPGRLHSIVVWAGGFVPWVNPGLGRVSLAIFSAVAVLVIACPCALGLATPTVLMVSSGLGASRGILIRQGQAIQKMQEVTTVVLDKTGTITTGQPGLTAIIPIEPSSTIASDELLRLAASAEAPSEHPLARAVVSEAERRGLALRDVTGFEAILGKGVRCNLGGQELIVGKRELLAERGIDFSRLPDAVDKLEERGDTALMVAYEGKLIGCIGVSDKLKPDSGQAIDELKRMRLAPVMITGGSARTAEAIAREIGIARVWTGILPQEKASKVRELQEKGEVVAMVGDGINDAPALAQADVGIAIGTGTDIAIEAADITLVRGELSALVSAVKLSRATFGKIRQNLFWAFFYNVLGIPVAMLGVLHPVIAEICMAASSLVVVTNSLRLRRARL